MAGFPAALAPAEALVLRCVHSLAAPSSDITGSAAVLLDCCRSKCKANPTSIETATQEHKKTAVVELCGSAGCLRSWPADSDGAGVSERWGASEMTVAFSWGSSSNKRKTSIAPSFVPPFLLHFGPQHSDLQVDAGVHTVQGPSACCARHAQE